MKSKRVQLSRARGWRMPANTIKVDRSTKWGNPFKIGQTVMHPVTGDQVFVADKEIAIALFAVYLQNQGKQLAIAASHELAGKNLACWCKPGDACHADVLLFVANHSSNMKKVA